VTWQQQARQRNARRGAFAPNERGRLEHVRIRDLNVLGLRLPSIEVGPANAEEAVVFLHGHPGSSRDWEGLLPQVGSFGRAVAFDLPGLGKADKPDNWDYTIGTYGSFVAAALSVLEIRRAHLVVHDLGGGAGLLWAAAHPDAFASAVIIATGVLIDYKWHWLASLQRKPVLGPIMVRLTNEKRFRASMRSFHRDSRKLPDSFVDRLWEDYDLASRHAMMTMYRAAPPDGFERLAPLFRELDRPALVLWGEKDPFVPVEQAYLQRESFPSAEVVVLEGSGHWPWIDNPEGAAAHIVPFLERQLAQAPTA
jgi:pimeloyl-ACP methyl ester carboxylesterase